MKTLNKVLVILAVAATGMFAQQTTAQTTLSAAIGTSPVGGVAPTTICLTSSTGVLAPGFGNPSLTGLMIDKEFLIVNAATPNTNCWLVTRGFAGTRVTAHSTSAIVWVGPTGGLLGSPYVNIPPVVGTTCVATTQTYLPVVLVGSEGYQNDYGDVFNCASSGITSGVWSVVHAPDNDGVLTCYQATDGGANNAVTASLPGLSQSNGACVTLELAHTLQAGANTFALNGATAVAIKSHFNHATNLATAYAATGTITMMYDGTAWVDLSE